MISKLFSGLGRALVPAALALALGGCSIFQGKGLPPCPDVAVLADAAKFTQFRPGEGRDITDIVLQGEITGFHGSCAYNKDRGQLTLTLQVQMVFTLGPAAANRDVKTAYFIAVPSFYPKPEAKKVMPVNFTFANAADHIRITDNEVDVILPAKDLAKDIDKLGVYVGFQLDKTELDYNRRPKAQ
jgi:hypothetical protein